MTLLDQATRVQRRHGEPAVTLDFLKAGVRLTADGEVEALGHVRYYLATWAARVANGEVPPPASWPEFVYDYRRGRRLTVPVVPDETELVAAALVALLGQPGMLQPIGRRCRGKAGAVRGIEA